MDDNNDVFGLYYKLMQILSTVVHSNRNSIQSTSVWDLKFFRELARDACHHN